MAAFARAAADAEADWPLADVEVQSSPQVTHGRLANGLRYYIRPHRGPSSQLSLRLLVQVGSLHERDDELGYAHFIEHLAFNGTKHYPAGELVRFLQRHGAEFGPHVNAVTSHTRTVYKLDLPNPTPELVQHGLQILRDFADGILIEAAEVRRERGVILSEDSFRHTPQRAEWEALQELMYGGTLIPKRPAIGTRASIDQANRASLRRFYERTYRPERMSVVISGDVAPESVEATVREEFDSLPARVPSEPEPEVGGVAPLETVRVQIHPRPFPGARVTFISATDRPDEPVTWARRLRGLAVQSSLALLQQRLARHVNASERLINEATFEVEVDYARFRRVSVAVAAAPDDLLPGLALLEQELRRAIDFGFSEAEVARHRTILRDAITNAARATATFPASRVADWTVDAVEDDAPLLLPDDVLAQQLETIDRLNPENCRRALADLFGPKPPRIFVSCAAQHVPTVEAVQTAYSNSRDVVVAPEEDLAEVEFTAVDLGRRGAVVMDERVADLEVRQLRFENDVRVNLKRTPFEAGEVNFVLRVGHGRLTEPPDQPGLGLWFQMLWAGGTGKYRARDLQRVVDGLKGITLTADEDAFVLKGSIPTANLAKALHQLTALLSDPAYRSEGWSVAESALRGQTAPMWHHPRGVVAQFLRPKLAGGDKRLGVPGDSDYLARTREEFIAWAGPDIAAGPIEFSLVGDFEPDVAIEALAPTLGALAPRQPREDQKARTELNFAHDHKARRYFFIGEAERPSRAVFFWRLPEPVSPRDRQHVEILTRVFASRISDEVREKAGASYVVDVDLMSSDVYPGYTFIVCALDLNPKDVKKQSKAVLKLAEALRKRGVTAEEFARAQAQVVAAAQRNLSDNAYWLQAVLADSQQRPWRLEAARTSVSDAAGATIADVNALATRYLDPKRVFYSLIEPNARRPTPTK